MLVFSRVAFSSLGRILRLRLELPQNLQFSAVSPSFFCTLPSLSRLDPPEKEPGSARSAFNDRNLRAREAEKILHGIESEAGSKGALIQRAYELTQTAISEGSVRGKTLLGFLHRDGLGVEKDSTKALQLLGEAAKLGDPYAQLGFGKMLLEATTDRQDENKDVLEKQKAFMLETGEDGKLRARIELVGEDPKAFPTPAELVRKVRKDRRKAGFSDPEAREFEEYKLQNEEKRLYDKKLEAIHWIKRASENGIVEASVLLGDLEIHRDAAFSKNMYEKVAEKTRLPEVYYRLGHLLSNGGPGVAKDDSAALKNFGMAANLGDPSAQFVLGHAYLVGDMELTADPSSSLQYIEMSAEQKHPGALYYLALMHRNGEAGLTASLSTFRRYLNESAALGCIDALCCLADMYYKGSDGVEVDYQTSLKYFLKAGELGSADALCSAAAMHFHGLGTAQSFEKAFYLYQDAVLQGSIKAMKCLGSMYFNGQFVPKSKKRAAYFSKMVEEHELRIKEEADKVKGLGIQREVVTAKTRTPRQVDPGCTEGPNPT